MTMADLGPERPGNASETRRMTEADRVIQPARVSGRLFWIAMALIVLAIAAFFAVR